MTRICAGSHSAKVWTRALAMPLALLAVAACSGEAEQNVYEIKLADAKAKIGRTQSQYDTGSGLRTMRPAGTLAGGVRVSLANSGAFGSACTVRFEAVDDRRTRVIPDCGSTGAATTDMLAEFFELEVAAHVRKILTGEPIDGEALGKRMAVVMAKNMPAMQKEGFRPDSDWVEQQRSAAIQRVENQQDGWGDDASAMDGWND
ncbi:hypothetical protein [Erythrobacter sp.]|uniref:hypothetical protein n=1 Tax=Erythrobacter sp. TaxID=1042 RepID=UPI002ECC9724|nr:hypothetical protein [Erythrobacter sp.]